MIRIILLFTLLLLGFVLLLQEGFLGARLCGSMLDTLIPSSVCVEEDVTAEPHPVATSTEDKVLPPPEALVSSVSIVIPEGEGILVTVSRDQSGKLATTFPGGDYGADGFIEVLDRGIATRADGARSVAPIVVNYGGTGSFVYIALFEHKENTLVHVDSLLLGDRITMGEVRFQDHDTVAAFYTDRDRMDPMTALPTIHKTLVVPLESDSRSFGNPDIVSKETYPAPFPTYKDMIRVALSEKQKISSPYTFHGEARGGWYFEASFPIVVVDWDGKIIGEGFATADGEWMTEEYVPFTARVMFEVPEDTPYRRGAVIFQKSNASGLPEHDDAFQIPVTF